MLINFIIFRFGSQFTWLRKRTRRSGSRFTKFCGPNRKSSSKFSKILEEPDRGNYLVYVFSHASDATKSGKNFSSEDFQKQSVMLHMNFFSSLSS
jgi:hypothetical protein